MPSIPADIWECRKLWLRSKNHSGEMKQKGGTLDAPPDCFGRTRLASAETGLLHGVPGNVAGR